MAFIKKLSTRLRKLRKSRGFRRNKRLIIGILLVAFGLTLFGISYANRTIAGSVRLVTFYDRGSKQTILTHAASVQEALTEAHISLAPQDVVQPVASTPLIGSDTVVNIYRARPVVVADGAVREKVMTPGQTPNAILTDADLPVLGTGDTTKLAENGSVAIDGAATVLTVSRSAPPTPSQQTTFKPLPNALSRAKSAQMFTDSHGITHRETYYDLLMNRVIGACGGGGYTIRADGAKVDKDGYVLVAASLRNYPRCSVVETSMGPGKVYDTGGFVARYPYGFDLATDWTNYDGR